MHARAYPFLRLLAPFLIGLSLGGHFDMPLPGLGRVLLTGAMLAILFAFGQYPYRFRWIFGAYLSLWLVGAGYFHIVQRHEMRQAAHFSTQLPTACYISGLVYDAPSKGARLKIPIRVDAIGAEPDSMIATCGNLLLFLQIDSSSEQIRYGDRLWVRAVIRATEPPANPYAFDYRRYLHFQNIHYQAFVKPDSFGIVSSGQGSVLWRYAFEARDHLLRLLKIYIPTPDTYAVASALLVGYKDDLSDELRTAYAETGSMHALAVSGSHVGMLYMGLLFLLQLFQFRGRWGRWIEALLVLAVIWAFTFITGATASVLRASVMFSTYMLGKLIYREASAWNVLALSAFGLLVYNPYFLFDAGFQLSYAAVAGMVFFYPRFYRLSPVMPGWLNAGWSVLLVGFAAQLGTLPLSLYYFHQFPVYFWLAGWVVVLGGAIFLWGGAVLAVLDLISVVLSKWLGLGLFYMLWGMNWLIINIQHLPGSVIGGVWVNVVAASLLYVGVVMLGAFMVTRKSGWLIGLLGLMLVLGVGRLVNHWEQDRQINLTLYDVGKKRLIDMMDGREGFALSDTLTKKQLLFAAQSNRWAHGVMQCETHFLAQDSTWNRANMYWDPPFLQFFSKKIVLLDHWAMLKGKRQCSVDVLVLSGNLRTDMANCLAHFPCKLVVFDATNSWRRVATWKAQCKELGVEFWDVGERGAYIVE
ncbi:MAG: ComEC/Rec2 family competence protein [Bacteroidota bacterium]